MKTIRRGALFLPLMIAAVMTLVASTVSAADEPVTVSIKSSHKSGVSARAALAAQGASTLVTIRVKGGGGNQYLPDIRSGTCASAAEAPEIPLAMASNAASSTTTIDVSLSDLRGGNYVIMLHRLDGGAVALDPKSAVACGVIGSATSEPVANAAPQTGVGPVNSAASMRWLLAVLACASILLAAFGRRFQQRGRTT